MPVASTGKGDFQKVALKFLDITSYVESTGLIYWIINKLLY